MSEHPYSSRGRVAVLGAGISGLTAAWRLKLKGFEVDLFDPAPTPGGVIQTRSADGVIWEEGPNSLLLRHAEFFALLEELDLVGEMEFPGPSTRRRYIGWKRRLYPISGPGFLLKTRLISWRARLSLLAEPFRPAREDPTETLGAFLRRRLGAEWCDRLASAFVHGVFAGDVDEMLLDYSFYPLRVAEQRSGSILKDAFRRNRPAKPRLPRKGIFNFQKGLRTLPDRLLERAGSRLHKALPETLEVTDAGWRMRWTDEEGEPRETSYQHVFCAVPLDTIPSLPFRGEARRLLPVFPPLPPAPVVVQNIVFRQQDCPHPLDGFGFLLPKGEDTALLGVIFSSTLFPSRVPSGQILLTAFLGGRLCPHIHQVDAAQRNSWVDAGLERYLGIRSEPLQRQERIWTEGIPQRSEPLPYIQDALISFSETVRNWTFLGNFMQSPGIPDCMLAAQSAVEAYAKDPKPAAFDPTRFLSVHNLNAASLSRHEYFMKEAIREASLAQGATHPNPMVGAVLVHRGRILAKAHHEKAGEFHAERKLLLAWEGQVPEDAILYVTLEPCCSHGRTPPCTAIILDRKISCVVVGAVDPDPRHRGKGLEQLRLAGVTVIQGVMEKACAELNPEFHSRFPEAS